MARTFPPRKLIYQRKSAQAAQLTILTWHESVGCWGSQNFSTGRISANAELVPGSYGAARRLEITADGIDYTAGQYAAREIWPAVLAYFDATNALEG